VSRATFRNRMAWALWIFAAIWMTFLLAMTWVVFRDGPPDGHSVATTAAIGALFWAAGIGLSMWTLDLAEGHARPPIEETAARFNTATRQAHA
jgi:hypothetical protein